MEGQSNSNHVFSEAGFNDVVVGAELFQKLNIAPHQFADPQQHSKLRDIASFLNDHPDPLFLIASVCRSNTNPSHSNLDHLWGYVALAKQKQELSQKLTQLDKELSYYQ